MTNTINSTLKIRIEKKYVPNSAMETVKDAVESFRYAYTTNDLLRFFNEQTANYISGNIVNYNIKAGFDSKTGAWYRVDMMIDDYFKIYRIHFYIDSECDLNLDPIMYEVQTYKLV